MRKPAIFLMVLYAFCLSSCHFGHSAEEIMNKYSNVERNIEFRFSAPVPGGQTRVELVDQGLNGISARWTQDESIALFDFGAVFVEPTNAIKLGFEEDEDDVVGVDYASFSGEAKAKMGENVFDGKPFALMFPYKKFADKAATTTAVELDFTGQDGTLGVMKENFLYAWGYAYGECEDAVVNLKENQGGCSSNQDWHSHSSGADEILLDNKMSIIRFSLIAGTEYDGDTVWSCLTEYLAAKNLVIDQIVIKNDTSVVSTGFSKAKVNLQTGDVTPGDYAADELIVKVSQPLVEIEEKDATPNSFAVNAEKVAWGTTFYLAIPCTTYGRLELYPNLTITTKHKSTGEPGITYYGALTSKRIKEGDYYMTAPIKVVDNKLKLQEEANIYLYYHSSFVFAVEDIY